MPTTPLKTMLYLAALPLMAPSVRGKLEMQQSGHSVARLSDAERIFRKHYVQGGSVLVKKGNENAVLHFSLRGNADHRAADHTMYRVASLTKTATTLVSLMLCEKGLLSLSTPITSVLPGGESEEKLKGITVEMLLSHRSGLCDTSAYDRVLASGGTYHDVLAADNVIASAPGEAFRYCNFGFGLMGCIIEQVTGQVISKVFEEMLFKPAGMNASLSAAELDEKDIMEITRVLQRRRRPGLKMTALGKQPLTAPDPERHFGHTSGAMYADIASVSRLFSIVADGGMCGNTRLLSRESIAEMARVRSDYGSISPGMHYGLGLVIYHDSEGITVMGHQGFAYGCVDGAFFDPKTGSQVVSLNGGASEARIGRMGRLNIDILRWAFGKELPGWT